MTENIYYADASDLAARIRAKNISPVEVVKTHIARIESMNPKLNAVVTMADNALELSKRAENAIMRGEYWGPLHGVPFTVKDSIDTKGVITTRGSKLFKDRVPNCDATSVARMKNAGGIFLAKTNLPEFVFWWETDNVIFGRTENPWKNGHTAGGSSGGEAAAIATGMSPLGIGSDVGGSIRQPAHFCGIVGLKPTHGRIPLTGHWPDVLLRYMHLGPMARSVRDAALGLHILAGPDGLDPYATPVPISSFDLLNTPMPKLRVGVCSDGPFTPVDTEIKQAVERAATALEDHGCIVEPVTLSELGKRQSQDLTTIVYTSEVREYVDPIVAGRHTELSKNILRRLSLPKPSLTTYLQAEAALEQIRRDIATFFTDHDLLLCPTSPVTAPTHAANELVINGQIVEPRNMMRATIPFDITGSPAITVPFGWSKKGLPMGVQLVGRHFDETNVLRASLLLEKLQSASQQRP